MALLMPRTAAKEALEVVQKLVQQQPESGMCVQDMVEFVHIVKSHCRWKSSYGFEISLISGFCHAVQNMGLPSDPRFFWFIFV